MHTLKLRNDSENPIDRSATYAQPSRNAIYFSRRGNIEKHLRMSAKASLQPLIVRTSTSRVEKYVCSGSTQVRFSIVIGILCRTRCVFNSCTYIGKVCRPFERHVQWIPGKRFSFSVVKISFSLVEISFVMSEVYC